MKNRKLLVTIVILIVLMLWVGYSSRKTAKTVRFARTFEPTAARLERGRYIVEGIAHCFECHSEVDWENPGGQPKAGRNETAKQETTVDIEKLHQRARTTIAMFLTWSAAIRLIDISKDSAKAAYCRPHASL